MDLSPATPENSCHVRSNSIPSTLHPLLLAVQEEIKKLEDWKTISMSPSTLTAETICSGIHGLKGVYDCLEVLLHLPLAQPLVLHKSEKWVDDELDGSVRLLDICSSARDTLLKMKEHVQDLQTALRRKGGESGMKSRVDAYISSRKKVKKDTNKYVCELKRRDNECTVTPIVDQDQHLSMVVGVLREVRAITISFIKTILSFISTSRRKPNPSKWSLVSKLMHKGQVTCVSQDQKNMNEAESVDVALFNLYGCISRKDDEMERVHNVQKRLEAFEVGIEGLEAGLECMFRCLIQTRVSLLNILTQ